MRGERSASVASSSVSTKTNGSRDSDCSVNRNSIVSLSRITGGRFGIGQPPLQCARIRAAHPAWRRGDLRRICNKVPKAYRNNVADRALPDETLADRLERLRFRLVVVGVAGFEPATPSSRTL